MKPVLRNTKHYDWAGLSVHIRNVMKGKCGPEGRLSQIMRGLGIPN